VVLRDADGQPYIPGASLAGACRSRLARLMQDSRAYRANEEPAELHVLFGDDYQSLLTAFDAPLKGETSLLVRDAVKIDLETGVAEDRMKFDLEVVPAGAAFEIQFAIVLYDELPDYWAKRSDQESLEPKQQVSASQIKSCFRLLLETMKNGSLHLGAKTRRGLGAGNVEQWDLRCLDMAKSEAVAAWLSHDPYSYVASNLEELGPLPEIRDVPMFAIHADFALDSSLLIRSPGEDANGPEFSHLAENGRSLLTGTSLTGALRHRAEKIANTIGGSREKSCVLVEQIFGYVRENISTDAARASRLTVAEIELPGNREHLNVQGRVAIDRFTGGALETALFEEAAYWPKPEDPVIRLSFCLEDPECREVGLLLLAFKDLWLGDLPVGGESGVGRGVMSGRSAKLSYAGHEPVDMVAPDTVTGPDTSWLNHCIEQLWRNLGDA
jgi:CRISPR/Cas system CSM-associated protein Csm3 (group 7 of RAMP superfamily)